MFALAAVGLTAFFLCFVSTPVVRNIFSRAKLFDHPDEKRKVHQNAMPRVGGIAVILSFIGALCLASILNTQRNVFSLHYGTLLLFLLPGSALIFVTGIIDDLRTLEPWQKLLGQTVAAVVAVSLGGRVTLHHGPVWLSYGISLLWLLVCTNAFNLIDGLDGLAAGIALFGSVATLISAVLGTNASLALAATALACCLLAFLRYNFPPASIFLGDCGSLTIGFILGCFALNSSQSTDDLTGIVAPLMMLSVPLLDVGLAVGRRFLRNAPLFQGDMHHIHHKVLARTLTARGAVLILYGISGLTAMLSLLFSYSQSRFKWAVVFFFCMLAIAGVASLRYIEFGAALRSVSRRSMLRLIKEEIYLEELAIALSNAQTIDALWDITCVAFEDLQVETLKMTLGDRSFYVAMKSAEEKHSWAVTVPLGPQGQLCLTRSGSAGRAAVMVAVLERLQRAISQKDFFIESRPSEECLFSYQEAVQTT